ncbi:MAG: hypothetical protein WBG10_06130 [Pseudolabrys sp.]
MKGGISANGTSRENLIAIFGVVMIVCLSLTIVTGAVALILVGEPIASTVGAMAVAIASVFSLTFFAAFGLTIRKERSRDS